MTLKARSALALKDYIKMPTHRMNKTLQPFSKGRRLAHKLSVIFLFPLFTWVTRVAKCCWALLLSLFLLLLFFSSSLPLWHFFLAFFSLLLFMLFFFVLSKSLFCFYSSRYLSRLIWVDESVECGACGISVRLCCGVYGLLYEWLNAAENFSFSSWKIFFHPFGFFPSCVYFCWIFVCCQVSFSVKLMWVVFSVNIVE